MVLLLLLALCVAAALPGGTVAQSGGDPPTELWKEYPLDETAPSTPQDTGENQVPQARPVEPAAEQGGGMSIAALIALVAGGLLVLGAALWLLRRMRRRQPPEAPAVEPVVEAPKPRGAARTEAGDQRHPDVAGARLHNRVRPGRGRARAPA